MTHPRPDIQAAIERAIEKLRPDTTFERRISPSLPFGARHAVEQRYTLARSWHTGLIGEAYKINVEYGIEPDPGYPIPALRTANAVRLMQSDLFWVRPDMCDLLSSAAPTVPGDVSLTEELLPVAVGGLVFLEQPIRGIDSYGISAEGQVDFVDIHVIHFSKVNTTIGGRERAALAIDCYVHVADRGFVALGGSNWLLGTPVGHHRGDIDDRARRSQEEDRRLVVAFVSLLKSPGITTTQELSPDRSTRRRCIRANINPAATRLVSLRSSSPSGVNGQTIEYHHRWIVSGHWRSQPHGPNNSLRKVIWIAPHLKGPEGAELLTGEKVKVL